LDAAIELCWLALKNIFKSIEKICKRSVDFIVMPFTIKSCSRETKRLKKRSREKNEKQKFVFEIHESTKDLKV